MQTDWRFWRNLNAQRGDHSDIVCLNSPCPLAIPLSARFIWRGGRVVECAGLENQRARKGSVGSNPTLSASV